MKKICISFLACAIIILSAIGFYSLKGETQTEYLRIHVRANSNLEQDQAVKYKVKDAVVTFLTPIVAECNTKAKAEETLKRYLPAISRVATDVLREEGFDYSATAKLNNELFPTRVYGDITLESGYYDALILELGKGVGDNWWCVVYPPLCFVGTGSYRYESKIVNIINNFFK